MAARSPNPRVLTVRAAPPPTSSTTAWPHGLPVTIPLTPPLRLAHVPLRTASLHLLSVFVCVPSWMSRIHLTISPVPRGLLVDRVDRGVVVSWCLHRPIPPPPSTPSQPPKHAYLYALTVVSFTGRNGQEGGQRGERVEAAEAQRRRRKRDGQQTVMANSRRKERTRKKKNASYVSRL